MRVIYDVETRSEISLPDRGQDNYFRHPSTEMLCATVATENFIGTASFIPSSDGRDALEREMRALGLNPISPDLLIAVLRAADTLVASNAPFDQGATARLLRLDTPKEKWSCTMARMMRHGLPGSLDAGCRVLQIPEGKDKDGQRLAKQCWKPRPTWSKWQGMAPEERARSRRKDAGPKWFEDAARIARVCAYNAADVVASRAVDRAIPELEPAEREIWLHVWRMRETGIPVDMDLIRGAIEISEQGIADITARVRHYTGGHITTLRSIPQLTAWEEKYGGPYASGWDKEGVLTRLADHGVPEAVRVVAQARKEASRGSVAKYETALEMVSPDGRLRHQIEYWGTLQTGRLAGRGVQPLNLPRPKIEADKSTAQADIKAGQPIRVPEWKLHYDPEKALHAIRSGNMASLRELGDPEEILSDNVRSMIKAPPGAKIVSPDLSAIEARGVFWVSDCERALDAYRRNEDLYCTVASQILGYRVNKKDHPEERQNYGKVPVLSCGYGAGVTTVAIKNKISEEVAAKAVYGYRDMFPEVKYNGWAPLEQAAIDAVYNPGKLFAACRGRVQFIFEAGWLRMCRPSGTWCYLPDAGVDTEGRLFYHFQHPKYGWTEESIWGGVLMNFVVQGFCRELMYHAEMQIAKDSRYELFLQCYDSLSALVRDEQAAALCDDMIRIMTAPPPWAPDMPLAAEGKPKERYG